MFNPPENAKNKENVAIHWNLEKIQMTEFSNKDSEDEITLYGARPFKGDRFFNMTKNGPFYPSSRGFGFTHTRYVHDTEDMESMKIYVMPGFKLRWYYTGDEVFSETLDFISSPQSVEFVRIVKTNLLSLFRPSVHL